MIQNKLYSRKTAPSDMLKTINIKEYTYIQ